MDEKSWREVVWDSYATYDQKLQIESLVANEIGRLQVAVFAAQDANVRCLSEWVEWVEHLHSELHGLLAAIEEMRSAS